ncbi:MAG: carbonic anhydrase [Candidatus Eremiobacteraeota bacterium]|nr:carbonic anhydrase [Candidatus Eremiobacteraeota bacterium]
MANKGIEFNRAAFLAGSVAALSVAVPQAAESAAPAGPGIAPDDGLKLLVAGNQRFVANDFPQTNALAEKRELLKESQAPFAALLSCADSRVIPEFIFIQGIGQLFVTRVAGNYPDNLVIGSLEYAIENLGTRLIVVLGHENCGAVKAVYSAIESKTPLPTHLNAIEELIAPGIESVVHARGSMREAVEANVRAAAARLRATPPFLATAVESGHVRVVGAVYMLGSGAVHFMD